MSKPCEWTEDEDGNWDTGCDNKHTFIDGGPADNEHVYCPYCGKKLAQCSYQPPEDDET